MKYAITTCLFCAAWAFSPTPARADHEDCRIQGTLCDSATHEALPYTTVRLFTPGAKPQVAGVATSAANGHFSIRAPKHGRYTLEVFATGREPLRRKVDILPEAGCTNLDTLYLKEYTSTLGTATVTAQKQLVRAELDKVVYSMADDPEALANSTLEMLRKLPMVSVDGENNVKVNGSSNFKIHVNGKPNQMMSANPSEVLKAYPASVIQKIEVITNPGAKYDAEGVGGVLNIITKKQTSTSGYTLTPAVQVENRATSAGGWGMVQWGKLMVSAFYGASYGQEPETTLRYERKVFGDDTNHLYLQENANSGDKGLKQFGSLEGSYEFSPKDLLNVSLGFNWMDAKENATGQNRMFAADGTQTYAYRQAQNSRFKSYGVNASADYQHTFKENRHLTLSYRCNLQPTDYRENEIVYSAFEGLPEGFGLHDLKSEPDNSSYEHTAQADFTTAFGKAHTLSAGLKYIYRLNSSRNEELSRLAGTDDAFARDDERSLLYRHRGDIGSAYAEYSLKLGKWSLMAGSRYEHYRVRVSYPDGKRPSFATEMNDWVPSLSTGLSLKQNMYLRAGYNLRINRPGIGLLSPYEVRNTPEAVSYGNPDLGSTQGHNLSLGYSFFVPKFSLNASLTHTFSNNEVVGYSFMRDGVMHTTYGNFMHSKVTNLSAYMNWSMTKTTRLTLNFGGNYVDYKSLKTRERNSGFTAWVWGGFKQELPWKLDLNLWFGGNSKNIQLQGKGTRNYYYGGTLTRSFLKEKRLDVMIVARNFIGSHRHYRSSTLTEGFRTLSESEKDPRAVGIAVRYRFGALKASMKKAKRTIQNNDVMQNPTASKEEKNGGGM